MENKTVKQIAEKAAALGGRAYYVGGCVRDLLLGIESKDTDIEVHGLSTDALCGILKEAGEPLSFGQSFGIYSVKGENIDVALPRKEHVTGKGHRDFDIAVDPFIGTENAARRRDFTVNAMMQDVLTGEVLDFFGGRSDLEKRILRHVDDESFPEDPLRVFRAAQFAARFKLTVASETVRLCRGIDVSYLSRERIEGELKKALLQAECPSVFFDVLKDMDQLDPWFKELSDLIGVEQDPVFHPEGDVYIHSLEVLDRGAALRDRVSDPYSFLLLCLTHDFGKLTTTQEKNGRIHAYGHETAGLSLVESFLDRITNESRVKEYVMNMVPLHMKPNMKAYSKASVKSTNRMFDEAADPADLIFFSMADKPVMSGDDPFTGDPEFLFERLDIYKEMMAAPFVKGQDLIDAGLSPGEYFSDVLVYAHKLRLAGIEKASALKQTLAYARQYAKENGHETK